MITCWMIWKTRYKLVFERMTPNAAATITEVYKVVREIISSGIKRAAHWRKYDNNVNTGMQTTGKN